MLTSVEKVDSLLDKEEAHEVSFPKLDVYAQNRDTFVYQDAVSELTDQQKSKKSFASFRIRPKGDYIHNFFEFWFWVKCLGTKDRMMIKAAQSLMTRIKQLIRSQALDDGEDEDNYEYKKVIRRITIYSLLSD